MIDASLTIIGAIWGVFALVIFRRFTNRAQLRTAINRIYGHLLEIRLYSEEPGLVWRAQKSLIAWNLRLLALIARPVVILAIPFALLYPHLDAIYGWKPLETGHSAIVTLKTEAIDKQYTLEAPPGITIETPPVQDSRAHEISWRIRPEKPIRGILRVTGSGPTIERTVAAGNRALAPNYRSQNSIEIDYPRSDGMPWLVWFVLVSTASSILYYSIVIS